MRQRHDRPLRIHSGAVREDASVADSNIAEPAQPELRIDHTDLRIVTHRVSALRVTRAQFEQVRLGRVRFNSLQVPVQLLQIRRSLHFSAIPQSYQGEVYVTTEEGVGQQNEAAPYAADIDARDW